VEVALRGGAFSEISDSNPVFTINSVLVTRARRLGNLRAEGRRDCDDVDIFGAVVDGHLFALTQVVLVSRELVGHLLNTEASPVESACLSVLGEDEVSGIESGCSSDARSFFSKLLHVERDSALALGCVVDLVDFVHGDHGIVHLEQVFVGDGSVIAFLDDVAFCVHDTEALYLFERVFEFHLGGERVLEHFRISLVHCAETARGQHLA